MSGRLQADPQRRVPLYRAWKNYSREKAWENFDAPDKDEVIDGAGIGNNQAHQLEPEFLESPALRFKVLKRVLLVYAVSF
jgi:hypothetical protein